MVISNPIYSSHGKEPGTSVLEYWLALDIAKVLSTAICWEGVSNFVSVAVKLSCSKPQSFTTASISLCFTWTSHPALQILCQNESFLQD